MQIEGRAVQIQIIGGLLGPLPGDGCIQTASSGDAAGNIRIETDILYDGAAARSLTFEADHGIRMLANNRIISKQAPLDVTLKTAANGEIQLLGNNRIETKGGHIDLHHGYKQGDTNPMTATALYVGSGPLLREGYRYTQRGTLPRGGGEIKVTAQIRGPGGN